ncbi:MAG: hypothetical protein JNM14_00320 [Ferruginibacter sp.]|nr:hypothetical protein [Ferruginibacter sp.]
MQKLFFTFLVYLLATVPAFAQKKTTYPVVITFNSMCCGVPSDEPLMKMVQRFKKQYKIKKLSADRIGPMGREGEYWLAFGLKELSKTQRVLFIKQLKKTAATMTDKGTAEVKENETVDRAELSGATTVSIMKF